MTKNEEVARELAEVRTRGNLWTVLELQLLLKIILDRHYPKTDELTRLKAFLKELDLDGDIDGGDFLDKAIEAGIIIEVSPTREWQDENGTAKCYNYYWLAQEKP